MEIWLLVVVLGFAAWVALMVVGPSSRDALGERVGYAQQVSEGAGYAQQKLLEYAALDAVAVDAVVQGRLSGNGSYGSRPVRLIRPELIENPEDLADSSITNIILKPGVPFRDAVQFVGEWWYGDGWENTDGGGI